MKILLLFVLAAFLLACSEKRTSKDKVNNGYITTEDFDWLVGNWKRTNDKPPRKTFEKWEKISTAEYKGFGFTLENQDTVFKEYIRIVKSKNSWVFEVRGVNENMTPFEFTDLSESSFICENERNEFPKKISYFKNENNLKAVISGNGNKISFEFERTTK